MTTTEETALQRIITSDYLRGSDDALRMAVGIVVLMSDNRNSVTDVLENIVKKHDILKEKEIEEASPYEDGMIVTFKQLLDFLKSVENTKTSKG